MEFLVMMLTVSLILSLIMLGLLGFSVLSRQALNAQTRYVMWVILLLGLIIPFRPLLGDGLIKIENPLYSITDVDLQDKNLPQADEPIRTDSADRAADGSQMPSESAPLQSEQSPRFSIAQILVAIWLTGALILFSKFMLEYRKFHRLVKRWGKPVDDPFTLETFEWVKAKMGLENKKIDLFIVRTVSTPMLTGLIKPAILLPEKPIADDEMELILEHELTHYKHKDLWINLIGILALSMHWFNPILYLCLPAVYGDGESYCDESVLKNKDLEYRRFYGEVIISMIEASPQKQIALSTCFYAKKLNIKRRLFHIMESHGKRRKLSLSSVTLILCLTVVSGSVIVFADPSKRVIGIDKAAEIAFHDAGFNAEDVLLTAAQKDASIYDVQFYKNEVKYEYKIDAKTGAILNKTQENKTATNRENNAGSASTSGEISSEQAKQIALRHTKLNVDQIAQLQIELRGDKKAYKVEFKNKGIEYDYEIDAKTGEILKIDRSDDLAPNTPTQVPSNTNDKPSESTVGGNEPKQNQDDDRDDDENDYDEDIDDDAEDED